MENNKEFWLKIGKDLGETNAMARDNQKEIEKIVKNDLPHLTDKIDKLSNKVAKIMGGIGLLWLVAEVLIRVLL